MIDSHAGLFWKFIAPKNVRLDGLSFVTIARFSHRNVTLKDHMIVGARPW